MHFSLRLVCQRALLLSRAENGGSSGGGFASGFVVGGVLFGTLGFLFAPQVPLNLR